MDQMRITIDHVAGDRLLVKHRRALSEAHDTAHFERCKAARQVKTLLIHRKDVRVATEPTPRLLLE